MFWLFLITVVGVNAAPFVFAKLDIWHAQGFWVQTGIMLLFSWSFFEKPKPVLIKNHSLGILHLWVGLSTATICFFSLLKDNYGISRFLPYFNFLCLLIFYRIGVSYLDKPKVLTILKWMRYAFIATLFACVLQYFGLAQFFEMLHKDNAMFFAYWNNPVVGFIGNGTHLAGVLGMCLPLLFIGKKRENVLAFILTAIILIFLTGTHKNDPAISGILVGMCSIIYYYYHTNKPLLWKVLICLLILGCLVCFFLPSGLLTKFASPMGRLSLWKTYWKIFIQAPITGAGLGTVNILFKKLHLENARHLHLEYYHFALELGIIGLMAILYAIKKFFEVKDTTKEQVILKAICVGYLVSCFFNFPAHLWLPSIYFMFCYTAVYAIQNQRSLEDAKGQFIKGNTE